MKHVTQARIALAALGTILAVGLGTAVAHADVDTNAGRKLGSTPTVEVVAGRSSAKICGSCQ